MHYPETYLDLLRRYGEPIESLVQPLSGFATVYPPVGFLAWPFGDVGNGDFDGYYWPIGREARQPVVAQMSHDYWALNPTASSVEALIGFGSYSHLREQLGFSAVPTPRNPLECFGSIEAWASYVSARLEIDPHSPHYLVARADVAVAQNEPDRAVSLYQQAVEWLPEYTAAHYGLAVLSRRQRRPAEVVRWCLEAVRSPLAFRGASFWAETCLPLEYVNRDDYRRKCLHWLGQAKPADAGEFERDPLFRERHRLTFATGVTTNDDFLIYQDAVAEYLALGQPLVAIRLAMLYGELISAEATPFRERYGFTLDGHRDWLV